MQPVSRWEEIQETVIYHSQMAAVLNSRTKFRLLNDPGPSVGLQEFSVAEAGSDVDQDIRQARLVINRAKPDGVTPLTQHIWEIQAEIRHQLPHLRRTGRRVSFVIEVIRGVRLVDNKRSLLYSNYITWTWLHNRWQ